MNFGWHRERLNKRKINKIRNSVSAPFAVDTQKTGVNLYHLIFGYAST